MPPTMEGVQINPLRPPPPLAWVFPPRVTVQPAPQVVCGAPFRPAVRVEVTMGPAEPGAPGLIAVLGRATLERADRWDSSRRRERWVATAPPGSELGSWSGRGPAVLDSVGDGRVFVTTIAAREQYRRSRPDDAEPTGTIDDWLYPAELVFARTVVQRLGRFRFRVDVLVGDEDGNRLPYGTVWTAPFVVVRAPTRPR